MKKILFLIHDLGQGGAEKVLVNLVNNMDTMKFDITVMTLFDIGVNRQFLNVNIKYKTVFSKVFPANSHIMKLMSPTALHKIFIKEHYDIEVAYLEGPCSRIISGCPYKDTKLVSWIHIEQKTKKRATASFRNMIEAIRCYNKFNQIVCVSETVKTDFLMIFPISVPIDVYYNTNESSKIVIASEEVVKDVEFSQNEFKMVGIGKLLLSKGFDRLLRIVKKFVDNGYPVHLYILGIGPEERNMKSYITENKLEKSVDLLGYQVNPYKYMKRCDLFVCASHAEGFSTAATEALIVGLPVCTVEVSGMREMLGAHNEFGIITDNNDEALYKAIKELLDNPEMLKFYRNKAKDRGKKFNTENTVLAVEKMFLNL
ncbi:MAG: glycosyltransferase [Sellimonas sp.]|uniref:glycosyltransferase n=1 Tax=Sellimonas sp. TaxID=2021466 RepID=UPI0039A3C532